MAIELPGAEEAWEAGKKNEHFKIITLGAKHPVQRFRL